METAILKLAHRFGESHATGCDIVDKVGTPRAVELDGTDERLLAYPERVADLRVGQHRPKRLEASAPVSSAPVRAGNVRGAEQSALAGGETVELAGAVHVENSGAEGGAGVEHFGELPTTSTNRQERPVQRDGGRQKQSHDSESVTPRKVTIYRHKKMLQKQSPDTKTATPRKVTRYEISNYTKPETAPSKPPRTPSKARRVSDGSRIE